MNFLKKDNKKNKKTPKKKNKIPKTAQDTISFEKVYDDGIIYSNGFFSKQVIFEDINYQTLRDDEQVNLFYRYSQFLNSFDQDVNIQIIINNKNIDKDKFHSDILLKKKSDKFDYLRDEYNEMLTQQLKKGQNNISRERYIVFSIKENNIDEARRKLSFIENRIEEYFKQMQSKIRVLGKSDRIHILNEFYRNSFDNFEDKLIAKNTLGIKNLISPSKFEFKHDYFLMGNKFARVSYIKDLPTFINDKILYELIENPFNMMLTVNIKSVRGDEAVKLVRKQIIGMEGNKIEYQKRASRSGYSADIIPHSLSANLDDAKELLDDLQNKNQKMFLVSILICSIAENLDALNKQTEILSSVSRKFLCNLSVLKYQQEKALNSVLPLGINSLEHLMRTLTTDSTAIFIPFSSQELVHKRGKYYGLSAINKNMIVFDRLKLKSPNGFILGTPGSGKSFSAKREITNIFLNSDDDIIIVDPEREYSELSHNFDGQNVYISANSKHFINPFDMSSDYSDTDDPLLLKSEFILSLCEFLLGGKDGLSAKEKTIIDRCIKKTYINYIQDFDSEKIPTLIDFHEALSSQNEPESQELALALEIYAKGSLSLFSHKTNIDLNNRLVIYDIKDLGNQLKNMGMLIVLDNIWNRITDNRAKGKRTWLYLDEIYLLFTNDFSESFLFELFKRSRKWGAVPTGITQNIEDLLQSEMARRMLSNSDFLLLFNQSPSDRNELANLLSISDTLLSYVTSSDEGSGLIYTGNSAVPFVDKFPKELHLYKMMTTKVDEIDKK
jgi:type IV secretory pathway VirB4 component